MGRRQVWGLQKYRGGLGFQRSFMKVETSESDLAKGRAGSRLCGERKAGTLGFSVGR